VSTSPAAADANFVKPTIPQSQQKSRTVCSHRSARFILDAGYICEIFQTAGLLSSGRIYPKWRILSDSVSCPHSRLRSRWSGSSRFLRIGDLRGFRRSPQLSHTPSLKAATSECRLRIRRTCQNSFGLLWEVEDVRAVAHPGRKNAVGKFGRSGMFAETTRSLLLLNTTSIECSYRGVLVLVKYCVRYLKTRRKTFRGAVL